MMNFDQALFEGDKWHFSIHKENFSRSGALPLFLKHFATCGYYERGGQRDMCFSYTSWSMDHSQPLLRDNRVKNHFPWFNLHGENFSKAYSFKKPLLYVRRN